MKRCFFHVVILAALFAFAGASHARLPAVNSIAPLGAQRGTEVVVSFTGSRLQNPEEIIFYSPGIECLGFESVRTNAVRAKLRIAPDCRPGEHHLRLRTQAGLSHLRAFFVSDYPHITEKEPNDEIARAQRIPLNSTVSGVITADDFDCFVVRANKGDLLSVEIEALRLGRSLFDPFIAVLDQEGNVLAECDDAALLMQDAFVSLVAPFEGDYFVLVRETTYGGNAQFRYRLHVGTFPRPAAVFPPGGPAGETIEFQFIGIPGSDLTQAIQLPEEAGERFGIFAELDGAIAPSPNWIRVSQFPNVLESAPNNTAKLATSAGIDPPFAFNGIISEAGEADWFRFNASKGQPLEVTVHARRLRSPLDSVLEIYDGRNRRLAQNDDAGGPDSHLRFNPPADGEYFLRIQDQLERGGPDFTYRIEITSPRPEVELSIPRISRNDTQTRQYIVVPRGNRFASVISARRSNFNGELELEMDGLPEGLTLRAALLGAGQTAMPVVFEAAPDAPMAGRLLDWVARSTEPDATVTGRFLQNAELVLGPPNNTPYYIAQVDRIAVAVVEEAPFKIEIIEPKVPLVQNGTMDLKVVAERTEGFDEPITLQMLWNPSGVGAQPEITIEKGKTSAIYQLNANASAAIGHWKIAILGTATIDGGPVWVSSQLAGLEVAAPLIEMKIETTTLQPGESAKVICKIEQREAFEGKAVAKLLGLPDKLSTAPVEFTAGDTEAVFEIQSDAKTPPAFHRTLFAEVTIMKEGEPIVHKLGSGGILRIIAPPKSIAEAAKLEAGR